jgi:hypothetical protein
MVRFRWGLHPAPGRRAADLLPMPRLMKVYLFWVVFTKVEQSNVLRERIWVMLQVPDSKSIARRRRVLLSRTTLRTTMAPYPHGHAVEIYLHSHGTSFTPIVEPDEKVDECSRMSHRTPMVLTGPCIVHRLSGTMRPMLLAVIECCCVPNNPRIHAYLDTTSV